MNMKKNEMENMFDSLAEQWKAEFVSRQQLHEFTRGILKAGTVSNLDSKKQFVKKYRIGRKVFYKTADVIEYLNKRIIAG